MYESFYGLSERPFDISPNPRFLFLTSRHREALSNLKYGLSSHKCLTLLLGEAGTGKTTIVRAALQALQRQELSCVYISNPTLTRSEFYEYLAAGFGLGEQAAASKTRFLFELQRHVAERHRNGGITSLIIDEAQSLPDALLEEIRLLANIETSTMKLLPLVLVGQPELAERLNEPQLRQLKQRVALRCELGTLGMAETAAYIAGRIRIAGGNAAGVFTREAVMAVHQHSRGIPRTISVICDNALLSGFAVEAKPVGEDIVQEVCRDFDLTGTTAPSPVPALPEAYEGTGSRVVTPLTQHPRFVEREPEASRATEGRDDAAVSGLFSHFTRRRRFKFF